MHDDELRAFLAVVDHGSLLAAAEALRVSRATLRRRLDALEARAGVPLVTRTRHGATTTPAGEVLAERGRGLIRAGERLISSLREVEGEPSGTLKVLLPIGLPPHLILPTFSQGRSRYPRLGMTIRFHEDPLSRLLDDHDVVLYFGSHRPRGPWRSRLFMSVEEKLMASPHYLRRRGTPATVEALAGHDLLTVAIPGDQPDAWPLRGGGVLPIQPILVSADAHLVRQAVAWGHGIGLIPNLPRVMDPGLDANSLVEVLPGRIGRRRTIRVAVPEALSDIPRIRALFDELAQVAELLDPDELPEDGA